MESVLNWSVIISIIGVLVVLTNIVVQVLKKVTWDKLPTNALAMIVSLVLTLGAFFAYCSIKGDRCCVVYGVCRGGPRIHGGLCGNVRI